MATPAFAYILPYPSFMPGHKFYRVEKVFDQISGWWSFGNLAQFKHCLKVADKKLVESKILFEYGQLALGLEGIQKYKFYLNKACLALERAKKEKKNISQKKEIFEEALRKHKEVLDGLLSQTPEAVFWQEEKKKGRTLEIQREINSARSEIERVFQELSQL
jgi:hypothetical protein